MPGRVLCWSFAVALAGSAMAAQTPAGEAVVQPGHEALFAAMLGQGEPLPAGCSLTAAAVDRALVRAEYRCASGRVAIELRHPPVPFALRETERFAVVAASGAAPAALVDELEARIRARESAFEWQYVALADGEAEPIHAVSPQRSTLLVLLPLVLAACVAWWLRRRFAGGEPRRRAVSRGAAAVATCSFAALGLAATLHGVLWLTGASFAATLRGASLASLAPRAALVTLLLILATVAGVVLARAADRWILRWLAAALILGYTIVGTVASLPSGELHHYGPLSTYPPGTELSETLEGQKPVTYTINSHGFRVPDFDEAKSPGVTRVVLLGDSFVFGIGVDDDATLHRRLAAELETRWPTRTFEVVNLGIPGNNLASHVTMYETAVERLAPDAVILALTLANDLSRWDEQEARRDARRLSPFRLARFLFGDAAEAIWAFWFLERETTPAGVEHLEHQLRRLLDLRADSRQPLLVLFGFQAWHPAVADRLNAVGDAIVVPNRAGRADEFIPGDGHPTRLGNTRFAAHITDSLAASRAWRQLLAAPVGGRQ